jgi:hypothetical protein
MRIPSWRAPAKLGLLAGLWLTSLAAGWGQEPATLPGLPLPEQLQTVEDPAPKADADKPKADDPPPSCWEKVPPIPVFAPPGFFPVLPTGPGYYSLLDLVTGTYREAPPQYGYPRFAIMMPSFFNADFRYLDSPKNTAHDLFDSLHRIHLGDNWRLATGGEFRWRHMHEIDSRLTGVDNDYDLLRTRVYGDLWYRDVFRVYVEYLDARSYNEDLLPLRPDVDHSDLLNLFIDLKVAEVGGQPVYVRGGR